MSTNVYQYLVHMACNLIYKRSFKRERREREQESKRERERESKEDEKGKIKGE
jgi:hypothetical protein